MLYGEESVEHEVKADEVDGDNEVNPSENVESGVASKEDNPEDAHENIEGNVANEDEEEEEDDEDSDDDDNVCITINQEKIEEAKTNFKTLGASKSSRQILSEKKGKFNVEDFDRVGTIDGTPAHEVDIESLEEKPWRKPGADLSDYFNYGFTEETWAAYCARQKRIRLNESGAGLPNSSSIKRIAPQENHHHTVPTVQTKPNSSGIAVLTADKREYSKKLFDGVDFSRPPPGMNVPPPNVNVPPNFNAPPPTGEDFDAAEDNYDYYGGYEPTQESQWVAPPSTYGGDGPPPSGDAPPGDVGYDDKRDPWQRNGQQRRTSRESPSRDRKRRRTRSRSRDREYGSRYRAEREYRDRDRDRDRRRRRSRSRSRERGIERERKRSRSPRDSRSPSSHRHKKSKKDKREKSDHRDVKREVKEEPDDYVE